MKNDDNAILDGAENNGNVCIILVFDGSNTHVDDDYHSNHRRMEKKKKGEIMTEETMRDIAQDMLYKWPKLMKWLDEMGFYEKPAAVKHHSNHRGGLFLHSLQVTYELQALTQGMKLKWEREESPIIVGMLHDVCKLEDYRIVNVDNSEKAEFYSERSYSGHGEKSLIMLMNHIELTEEEKMCIRYHMGAFTDSKEWEFYSRAVRKYPNVLYAHTADMIASQIKGV